MSDKPTLTDEQRDEFDAMHKRVQADKRYTLTKEFTDWAIPRKELIKAWIEERQARRDGTAAPNPQE